MAGGSGRVDRDVALQLAFDGGDVDAEVVESRRARLPGSSASTASRCSVRTSAGAPLQPWAIELCAAASGAQVASVDIGGMLSLGASAGGPNSRCDAVRIASA
jgi:hypothetical protein